MYWKCILYSLGGNDQVVYKAVLIAFILTSVESLYQLCRHWILTMVSANYRTFTMVSANHTAVAVSSLLSVRLAVIISSLILSPSFPFCLSLTPPGPLFKPINRTVGGDGGALRETEHFSWFPEKGNDRPRQYWVLYLLRILSALLTRLEAEAQKL